MNHISINGEIAYESIVVPNYFVTKTGKVYSTYVIGGQGSVNTSHPHELKYGTDKDGYLRVVLSLNGKKTYINVHQLIVEQFLGHVEDGFVINHLDGNKKNNNVSNLEITTSKENTIHAHKNHLTSRECAVYVEHNGVKEYFYSIKECLEKIPDLSRHYLEQLRNNIVMFSMVEFRKTEPNKRISKIEAYYNGEHFKTFNNMREAGLYFGKSRSVVSIAISKENTYRNKVNKYHIEFPSVSTIESTVSADK